MLSYSYICSLACSQIYFVCILQEVFEDLLLAVKHLIGNAAHLVPPLKVQ